MSLGILNLSQGCRHSVRRILPCRRSSSPKSMKAVLLPLLLLGVASCAGLVSAAAGLPAFNVDRWVNSARLTPEALRGKVVLLDIWEYTCINWIRTSPYV